MTIKARKASDFIPAPAGTHLAVCVDVIDNGEVKSEFQGKTRILPKVTLRWETRKPNPKNNLPYLVQQRYTNSTHPKSNLGQMLSGWFGRALTIQETSGEFDLETLIGRCALLSVIHNERDGQIYANVAAISPLMEGMESISPSREYVRVVNRPTDGQATAAHADEYDERNPPPSDDDEIPF
jgi:hypothetical protein